MSAPLHDVKPEDCSNYLVVEYDISNDLAKALIDLGLLAVLTIAEQINNRQPARAAAAPCRRARSQAAAREDERSRGERRARVGEDQRTAARAAGSGAGQVTLNRAFSKLRNLLGIPWDREGMVAVWRWNKALRWHMARRLARHKLMQQHGRRGWRWS